MDSLSSSQLKSLAWAAIAVAALASGFFLDAITLKWGIMVGFAIVGVGVLSLPYRWAFPTVFVYLVFEGMFKLLTNWNPIVHVGTDLLVLSLTARWFVSTLVKREPLVPRPLPPLSALFAMFFAWYLIEFANPYSIGLIPSIAGFKMYGSIVVLYLFGYYLATDARQIRRFIGVWAALAVFEVALTLYQGAVGPTSVTRLSPNYSQQLLKYAGYAFRPFGTSNIPGGASNFIWITLPFVVYLIFRSKAWIRATLLLYLPAAALALLLCQVRAALLKAIIGVSIFLFLSFRGLSQRARLWAFGASLCVIAALAVALPQLTSRWEADYSDNARAIERSLSIFNYDKASEARRGALDRIVGYAEMVPLGAGISRGGAASGVFIDRIHRDPYFPYALFSDNFWALTIAEIGLPGSILLTVIFISLVVQGARNWRRIDDPELSALNAVLLATLCASIVGLWGAEGILYEPEMMVFWFFGGALMRLARLEARPAEELASISRQAIV